MQELFLENSALVIAINMQHFMLKLIAYVILNTTESSLVTCQGLLCYTGVVDVGNVSDNQFQDCRTSKASPLDCKLIN